MQISEVLRHLYPCYADGGMEPSCLNTKKLANVQIQRYKTTSNEGKQEYIPEPTSIIASARIMTQMQGLCNNKAVVIKRMHA